LATCAVNNALGLFIAITATYEYQCGGGRANKRHQLFVSSTLLDLVVEHQKVLHAFLKLNCFAARMERFPAADDDQWMHIEKVIEGCN
jgi:hypothetical protein